MKSLGYSVVPKSKTFFTQEWATIVGTPNRNIDGAYAYACKIGFPVVVKPNSGSQGSGVAVVSNKREFYKAVRNVFTLDRIVLVQEQVRGKDYRLVVLDKKVVSAYERVPLNVTGNGKSTIQQLLRAKQKSFKIIERDTFIDLGDSRIRLKLKAQKRTYDSVLAKGETVYLLDNANLSTGGDSLDVSEAVHSGFKKLAIQLTADMGLRLCGVDFMIAGDITKPPKDYWILEINSAPGLDHYIKLGKAQEKIVEDLYREVFKHLE